MNGADYLPTWLPNKRAKVRIPLIHKTHALFYLIHPVQQFS